MGDTCPIRDWKFVDNLDPLKAVAEAIVELGARDLAPDQIRLEERGQFDRLTACNTEDLRLLDSHLDFLTRRLTSIPTGKIAATLKGLYEQAYRYDPAQRTMGVVDEGAKRRLDLFIAAIDRQAYRDRRFLTRVKGGAIETMMVLNSPDLAPKDRALFYESNSGKIPLAEVIAEVWRRGFLLNASYEGGDPGAYFDSPAIKSQLILDQVFALGIGKRKWDLANQRHLPEEQFERFLADHQLQEEYAQLRPLSAKEVRDFLMASLTDLEINQNPADRKKANQRIGLAQWEFSRRGIDPQEAIIHGMGRAMPPGLGISGQDVIFFVRLGLARDTPSRLDDYDLKFRSPGLYGVFEQIEDAEREGKPEESVDPADQPI